MEYEQIKRYTEESCFNVFTAHDAAFTHGEGCKLYDTEGREYTDFLAGIAVNALGYGDKELSAAIAAQAEKLVHTSNLFYNEERAGLLRGLTAGCGFDKAFLCNSGGEANEAAIKLIRRFVNARPNPGVILCAENSFHGRTVTTATATGQPKYSAPFAPLTPGFAHVPFGDETALAAAFENDKIAAVLIETIQAEGGVFTMTPEYAATLSRLCAENGALLALDEVQTGLGRCGALFSFELFGLKPDIITLAKALGGGLPLGAMLARGEVAGAFVKGDHGSTFGGNPVACAAANVVLRRISEPAFLENVRETGKYFEGELRKVSKYFESESRKPEAVRGKGLLLGLPLPESVDGRRVVAEMLKKGYIINCAARNTLRFVPPLVISKKEIDGMTAALRGVLRGMGCGNA